jgi:hypothetical protein
MAPTFSSRLADTAQMKASVDQGKIEAPSHFGLLFLNTQLR